MSFRDAQERDLCGRRGGHSAVFHHDRLSFSPLQKKLYVHAEVSVIWQRLLQTDELASQWPRWKCFTPRTGNTSRGLMRVWICVFFYFSQGDCKWDFVGFAMKILVHAVAIRWCHAHTVQVLWSPTTVTLNHYERDFKSQIWLGG